MNVVALSFALVDRDVADIPGQEVSREDVRLVGHDGSMVMVDSRDRHVRQTIGARCESFWLLESQWSLRARRTWRTTQSEIRKARLPAPLASSLSRGSGRAQLVGFGDRVPGLPANGTLLHE